MQPRDQKVLDDISRIRHELEQGHAEGTIQSGDTKAEAIKLLTELLEQYQSEED